MNRIYTYTLMMAHPFESICADLALQQACSLKISGDLLALKLEFVGAPLLGFPVVCPSPLYSIFNPALFEGG